MLGDYDFASMDEEKPTDVVEYDDECRPRPEHVQSVRLPALQSISDERHRSDRHLAILQWTRGQR